MTKDKLLKLSEALYDEIIRVHMNDDEGFTKDEIDALNKMESELVSFDLALGADFSHLFDEDEKIQLGWR